MAGASPRVPHSSSPAPDHPLALSFTPLSERRKQSYPFTAVPNAFLDDWMLRLDGNACKICLYLIRRTIGWQQPLQDVEITLDAFAVGTGISNRAALVRAIREAIDAGVLRVSERRGPRGAKRYAPLKESVKDIDKEMIDEVEESETDDAPSPEDLDALVDRVAHQAAMNHFRREYQRAKETLRTAMPLSREWIEAQREVRRIEYEYPELVTR